MNAKDLTWSLIDTITEHCFTNATPDGDITTVKSCPSFLIHPMAIAWAEPRGDNKWHHHEKLRDAIVAIGDRNLRSWDPKTGFTKGGGIAGGFDEWNMIAWLESMVLLGDALDAQRRDDWTKAFIDFGDHILESFYDQDTFDGHIPNHGIWNHAYFYRVATLFDVDRMKGPSQLAWDRILDGQSPDGCFYELQTSALMPGSPVTRYNVVSALAVQMYHHYSNDPRAQVALDKAWHFFIDYMLPDGAPPPCFDFRQSYQPGGVGAGSPAYYINQPEGQYMALERVPRTIDEVKANGLRTGHGHMFMSQNYPMLRDDVQPRQPQWPELKRMVAQPAGIRRRSPWHLAMSGMTNVGAMNHGLRLFASERQDFFSLYHEKLGLLVGSTHSRIQPDLSSFVFFDTGRAHYLHDEAYFKASPALDTILARYGNNVGAVSVDTNDPNQATIIFSLHGERGHHPDPGYGHTQSAAAAKIHLPLRLEAGQTVTQGDRSWTLPDGDENMLRLKFDADQIVSFGDWSLVCDGTWTLTWPIDTVDAYKVDAKSERVAVVEATLFTHFNNTAAKRPTTTFTLREQHRDR